MKQYSRFESLDLDTATDDPKEYSQFESCGSDQLHREISPTLTSISEENSLESQELVDFPVSVDGDKLKYPESSMALAYGDLDRLSCYSLDVSCLEEDGQGEEEVDIEGLKNSDFGLVMPEMCTVVCMLIVVVL